MRITFFRLIILLFIAVLPLNNSQLFGQNSFSNFKINAGIVSNFNKNLIHHYWLAEKGLEFFIESPFYYGNIQVGLITIPFKGKDKIYPDFKEYYLYAGYGTDISLPFKLSLYGGVKTGFFIMNYNDDSLSTFQRTESELSAGINFRLSYEIITNLLLSVSSDFTVL